jgi:hypothetical protein
MGKPPAERLPQMQPFSSESPPQEVEKEMFETGKTTEGDVIALMKEISLYGCRHPLSNESRLSMRKKIQPINIAFSLLAIWFTVTPTRSTDK